MIWETRVSLQCYQTFPLTCAAYLAPFPEKSVLEDAVSGVVCCSSRPVDSALSASHTALKPCFIWPDVGASSTLAVADP
ncbi:hypothetical protein SKAU_G00427400 [Synaphobranchus kaupii]|uniref:Uncharacterized protein n=1 Tax=Synaphobranchus kaupii TaxID=118154 RepID=A0A9Q1E4T7_SYNKA|nr:hypothetical protein SKAU_G00427400 [Synaphobranchus kaupii]